MDDIRLVPVGTVHSPIRDRRLMPQQGVPAEIEIYPEYADGLLLIQENTHLIVIGWFEESDRDRLQIIRTTYEPARRRRGVFGLRSTARPNSLAMKICKLESIEDGILRVDALDFIDGTEIVDIKRYSPSWDCIFSARSSRDQYLLDKADPTWPSEMETEAANFHGERCSDVLAGVRLVQFVALNWNVMPKDPELRVCAPLDPQRSHLVDAIQALMSATMGTGRLRIDPSGDAFVFRYREQEIVARPLDLTGMSPTDLRALPLFSLFAVNPD